MTDRLRRVFLALQSKQLANVLAPRVAGGDLLRERLRRGIDRDVDRKADVDRRSVHIDLVRAEAIAGRRCARIRLRLRIQPIQRAGRTLQRRKRLQHGA